MVGAQRVGLSGRREPPGKHRENHQECAGLSGHREAMEKHRENHRDCSVLLMKRESSKTRQKKIVQAVLLLTAFLVPFNTMGSRKVIASDDSSACIEITATLDQSTVSGNTPTPSPKPKPKPKPPGGGGGGDHHHHDDDDDPPPKKPDPAPKEPEPPVVPVVYLPGPGITKLKAVPVPGKPVIRTITETVTGNEAILPEPREPMRVSVSGNGVQQEEKRPERRNIVSQPAVSEEVTPDNDSRVWLIWLFLLLLIIVLIVWLRSVSNKRKRDKAKGANSQKMDEANDKNKRREDKTEDPDRQIMDEGMNLETKDQKIFDKGI